MPSVRTLRGYLARAETAITMGRERIARQNALVRQMGEAGHGISRAGRRLAQLRVDLECWQEHREHIQDALAGEETPDGP